MVAKVVGAYCVAVAPDDRTHQQIPGSNGRAILPLKLDKQMLNENLGQPVEVIL